MPHEHQLTREMRDCIQNCLDCHSICMETVQHCLMLGGRHADSNHIRLLLDCADICATAANFLLRISEYHHQTCRVCSELCRACADDCQRLADSDRTMQQCAEICRRCAQSCEKMASATV